jgi:hypothetical protein
MPSTSSTAKRATGPVVLSDRGLAGLATFGDPMERVRRNLHEQLGPPDEELTNQDNPMGHIFGICPGISGQYPSLGPPMAVVHRGAEQLRARSLAPVRLLRKRDRAAQRPARASDPARHPRRLHLAELRAAYGHQVHIFPIEAPASIGFRVGPPGGPAIDGLLSDATANGRVTQLHGGQGCGE